MIKKEKFLNDIDRLTASQRNLIPLLNRHVTASLGMSELKDIDRKKTVEFLQKLALMQARHLDVLQEIRGKAERMKRDFL